ncbi:glutathione dehydrogenase [Aureococcus anophagefferens]|nr:glutathione dehydrogenase [Aureococcus anophagefferens]
MESMEACFGTRPRPALRRLVPLLLLRCAAPLAAPKQAAAPSDAERYANRAAPGAMARGRALFTTLARYDAIYSIHFKTGFASRRTSEPPPLLDAMRLLRTVDLDFAKEHYYASHRMLNPAGIVPRGPACDLLGDDADLPPALTLADLSR